MQFTRAHGSGSLPMPWILISSSFSLALSLAIRKVVSYGWGSNGLKRIVRSASSSGCTTSTSRRTTKTPLSGSPTGSCSLSGVSPLLSRKTVRSSVVPTSRVPKSMSTVDAVRNGGLY